MKKLDKVKKLLKAIPIKRFFAENRVVEYEGYFYKCPNITWKYIFYRNKDAYKAIKNSYKIIKQYFWEDFDIVRTDITRDEELLYIIKQEKICWDVVSAKLFKNPEIRNKILLFLEKNKLLWKEKWLFLDVMWADAIFSPFKIHNLIIVWDQIFIFDFWFLNKKSSRFFFRYFSIIFYHLQILWLEKVLLRRRKKAE